MNHSAATHPGPADGPGDGQAGSFVHDALFYHDRAEFLAGTIPLLRDSLAAGTPTLVAVPPRSAAWVREVLGSAADKVRFVDLTIDGRNPNKIIPAVLSTFIDENPGRPVAIIGEPTWAGRSAAEYPACVQHEALTNVMFAGLSGTVLCPYDRALEPEALADAGRTHRTITVGGQRQASRNYTDPIEVVRSFNLPLPCPAHATAVLDFAGVDDLPRLREFVGRHAGAAGLAHDRSIDLQMAANEIATNTIRHGGGAGSARVWADDGHVLCDISDGGHIDDPTAGRMPPPLTSEGGRGLLVSNYLCDLVRLYSVPGLTTIRLFMRLTARER